jgi:hypothetical protein
MFPRIEAIYAALLARGLSHTHSALLRVVWREAAALASHGDDRADAVAVAGEAVAAAVSHYYDTAQMLTRAEILQADYLAVAWAVAAELRTAYRARA